jgi:subtilisin family serine protease
MTGLFDYSRLQDALNTGTGKGVRVAVLDTGVEEDHPDLTGKVVKHYEVVRAGRSYECVEMKGTDKVGHGTACAAIIKDIANDAEIYSIKVIGANSRGSCAELTEGLRWCVDNDMHIVNASLGTIDLRNPADISTVCDDALYKGISIIAAASNRGRVSYPANLSSVISVDFERIEDPLEFHYRLENPIEIEASGIMIEAPNPTGGKKLYTGTSFACPHVSGIAARIVSVYPGVQPFELRSVLYHLGRPAA